MKTLLSTVALASVLGLAASTNSTLSDGRQLEEVIDVIMACGVDCPFYDLPNQGSLCVGRVVNCQDYCDRSAGCRSAVWSDYQGGTCWFKTDMNLINNPKANSIASSFVTRGVLTPDQLIISPTDDCDMAGGDIGNEQQSSALKCGTSCVKLKDCWAWSWSNYNGGTCWFKNQARECTTSLGIKSGYVWKNVVGAGDCLGVPASGAP